MSDQTLAHGILVKYLGVSMKLQGRSFRMVFIFMAVYMTCICGFSRYVAIRARLYTLHSSTAKSPTYFYYHFSIDNHQTPQVKV